MSDIDGMSFLTGANAGFIADLYTRFLNDPASVDDSWRRFFAEIGEDDSAALAELRGPPWARPPGPTTEWRRWRTRRTTRRRGVAPSHQRLDPRLAIDPRLPRARPSRSRSRPARPRPARPLPRARLSQLWVCRDRSRSRDLSQQHFRPRARQPARDRGDPARHLLRQDRRRIHAHPGPGRARLDPAEVRDACRPAGAVGGRQKRNSGNPDDGRDLRAVSRPPLHRHQAVRHRGRGIADAGARGDLAPRRGTRRRASS